MSNENIIPELLGNPEFSGKKYILYGSACSKVTLVLMALFGWIVCKFYHYFLSLSPRAYPWFTC
jgi:hypothetical protein